MTKKLRLPPRNRTTTTNTNISTSSPHNDPTETESNYNHHIFSEMRPTLPLFVRPVFPSPNTEVEDQHSSSRIFNNSEMVGAFLLSMFNILLIH